MFLTTEEELL